MFDNTFISVKGRAAGNLFSLREANDETRELLGYALEEKVIERTPLKDVEASMLFTYMHRRFGLGNLGGDDYKDLGAGWMISTPREDLCLVVRPSFNGPGFSFIPMIVTEGRDRAALEDIAGERLQAMVEAYERTLIDLLRPVCERDLDFNVLGEIDDEKNTLPQWLEVPEDDEDYDYDRLPRYHETCGLPMPDGIFGGKDWQRLLGILRHMGDGDIPRGMEALVRETGERAIEAARSARTELLPIVAAGFYLAQLDDAADLGARIGVPQGEDPRVTEFFRAAYGHGLPAAPSEWFMGLTEGAILEAADLVDAFGVGTYQMRKAVKEVSDTQRYTREWGRFLAITGGEFEFDLVPDEKWITTQSVDVFRRNLAASGEIALSEWAEELAQDKDGTLALWKVLMALHSQKAAAANPPESTLES
jgi:hypothetical protein